MVSLEVKVRSEESFYGFMRFRNKLLFFFKIKKRIKKYFPRLNFFLTPHSSLLTFKEYKIEIKSFMQDIYIKIIV